MGKLGTEILGGVEIVAGTVLEFIPGGQAIGTQLIIAGVATLGSALLTPGAKPRDAATTSLKLGEVPRAVILGESAEAGSLVDGFNYGGKYGTDWEVLVIALSDCRTNSLTGFYVNDKYVVFSGDGPVSGYNGQLEVYFRNGTEDQVLPSIVTAHGPGWTSDDNGAGVTYVVVAYKADKSDAKNPIWPSGRPGFLWVVKGALCYDPRLDSTIAGGSGSQRWADPATRAWTGNAIACRYNYERGFYACDRVDQPDMLLVGRGLTENEAPPAAMAAPANLCDETVDGEARFRVDGTIGAAEQYLDVEQKFAAACGGIILQRDGAVEIEPGQAKAPSFAFTDDDIVSGTSIQWNNGILSEADDSWVNTVIPNYIEPSQKWATHDAPPRRDIDDILADGKPREQTLQLALVKRAAQAVAVAEYARRLGRVPGRGAVTLGPRFAEVEEGDWGTWTSARRFGGGTKTLRVESYGLGKEWRNQLQLREIAASVYDPVDAIEDLAVAVQPDAPPAIGAPDGGAWTLTAELLDGGAGALPALVIAGVVDDDYAQAVRFEYWPDDGVTDPADVTGWIGTEMASPSITRREITSIGPGGTYYAAVSYVVGGEPGDRLILGPVTTDAITPPGDIIYDGQVPL